MPNVRNVETRDMATRPATRCKAAYYIRVTFILLVRSDQSGKITAITAICVHLGRVQQGADDFRS